MVARKKEKNAPTFTRTPKVPNFSEAAIYIADLCAREAWIGNPYENGRKSRKKYEVEELNFTENGVEGINKFLSHPSDELFLILFATQLLRDARIPGVVTNGGANTITLKNLQVLIDAAQLNSAVNAQRNKVDLPQGLEYLKNDLTIKYEKWSKTNYKAPQPTLAREMVKHLSKELCTVKNGVIGYQTAIASRLLNFGFPDLPVYNYSTGIHRGLKLSDANTPSMIDKYYDLLNEGYLRNWHLLSGYEMPISGNVNPALWQRARNGGWWQRRVYDLALKLYFTDTGKNIFFASFSPSIQENIFTKARALCSPKPTQSPCVS